MAREGVNLQPGVMTLNTLILQDDGSASPHLRRLVQENPHYRFNFEICSRPTLASRICESCNFDLLIIDHVETVNNQRNFLQDIQSTNSLTPPPVVFISDKNAEGKSKTNTSTLCTDTLNRTLLNSQSLARSIHNVVCKQRLLSSNIQRSIELQRVNSELKNKNREIRDFYQTVSHEVKTPLAAAREFIHIVRDGIGGPVTPRQEELLDHALTSCDQIATHFNDLVEITRLDAGKVRLRRKSASIDSIITRTLASCAKAAATNGMQINTEIASNHRQFIADGDRIFQVLSNLLSNAIKYSDANSSITINVSDNNCGGLIFCIADQGCGIAEDDQLKIFDRLYQGNNGRHQFSGAGLGLGLSIAREMVTLHQGTLWVESTVGQGSQFYFSIPDCTGSKDKDQLSHLTKDDYEQKNIAC